ncbi:ectonucleotide pyrophosphatase/phosphodiesterase [Brevundimonas aveniformis]|uniref:alkaline phosphatase family protein n=1 Tax=Brevundimonas aveniformis TaxID=370977 RepID=UPI00041EDDF6|nr:ectonucleotide pyrophosphatase/phosphodiesterase [Brevundimonas aveniformis]
MRFLLLILVALAGLATPALARPVILIGIDGFRADFLDRGLTPTLSRLAAEGTVAEGGMRPSFPSVTYPNFYTLATGRHPDHHGLVYNRMRDPDLPGRTFSLGDRHEVMDPVWWNDAEPIWVSAERQGLSTAVLFWPGSEAAIHGVRPRDWLPFEQSVSSRARVNIALGWFTTPQADWPDFAAVYFDIVDTQGHLFGPNSPELDAALVEVDQAVGVLVAGLAARGIEADLVIVADHGMAATSGERVVWLDDWIAAEAVDSYTYGPLAFVDPLPGHEAELEAALAHDPEHLDCWRREDLPAHFAYGTHRRISRVVCLAELGWTLGVRGQLDPARVRPGTHGFDPDAPEMQAVFIAHGPSIRPGVRLTEMDSVDVQPLLGRLLGIEAPHGDGRIDDLRPALVPAD